MSNINAGADASNGNSQLFANTESRLRGNEEPQIILQSASTSVIPTPSSISSLPLQAAHQQPQSEDISSNNNNSNNYQSKINSPTVDINKIEAKTVNFIRISPGIQGITSRTEDQAWRSQTDPIDFPFSLGALGIGSTDSHSMGVEEQDVGTFSQRQHLEPVREDPHEYTNIEDRSEASLQTSELTTSSPEPGRTGKGAYFSHRSIKSVNLEGSNNLKESISVENLERYAPSDIEPRALAYMRTQLMAHKYIIPLWDPSPSVEDPKYWRWHVCIGDIGYLTHTGGFKALFNILITAEENRRRGYHTPDGFIPCKPGPGSRLPPRREEPMFKLDILVFRGFAPITSQSEAIRTLQIPKTHRKTSCAANHMASGYVHETYREESIIIMKNHISKHFQSWRSSIPFDGDVSSLILVTGTYKTKSWSILSATPDAKIAPSVRPYATLTETDNRPGALHWFTQHDNVLHRTFGPSSTMRDKMEQYLRSSDGRAAGPQAQRETEECYCVALKGRVIKESLKVKGSRASVSSILSRFSSVLTIKRRE